MEKIVYIVGFESTNLEVNGVSGWEWRDTVDLRDTIYNDWKISFSDCILYRGEITIPFALTNDEITDFIEDYLHKRDFDNAFADKIVI